MNQNAKLQSAITDFINACYRDYIFPMGGKVETLARVEIELLECLQDRGITSSSKIEFLQDGQDRSNCYSIDFLGIRLAVLGVRQ